MRIMYAKDGKYSAWELVHEEFPDAQVGVDGRALGSAGIKELASGIAAMRGLKNEELAFEPVQY